MGRKKNVVENKDDVVVETQSAAVDMVSKSKRGRKPKNAAATLSINNVLVNPVENIETVETIENIVLFHSEEQISNNSNEGENIEFESKETNTNEISYEFVSENDVQLKPPGKKRGRKPKGGKIIQQVLHVSNIKESKPNIILHLKCSLKELNNNLFENNINGYDFSSCKKDFLYEIISSNENTTSLSSLKTQAEDIVKNECCLDNDLCDNDSYCNKKGDMKDLWKKLKNLEYSLHLNNISDKKSACFWCTYEFDNPSIYIPKHYIKDSYHVYGCFCSPECATAYLMEENIDSSTKFERYHLLNHIYSKIYDYTKNIKPAPKPHYILEKFYGNLNIQEYRSLLKNERLFLVVDKPLTRILPELHEDNDDFIINNKIIPSNTYQIKRKMMNKQSKNNILSEKFGLQ